MESRVDAVVVGAGHAGLAISNVLTGEGLEHVVLERGHVAQRWRSERWDSFSLLTPNWATWLPNWHYDADDPQGFMRREEIVRYLERYASSFDAPVREGVTVNAVVEQGSKTYRVGTSDGDLTARSVVIATGPFQKPRLPAWSGEIPASVVQLHSSAYRSASELPSGAVLVVGSGPSGQQIAEDLRRSERKVYLAVGRHRRVPRRYRGRDYYWWLELGGFYEPIEEDVPRAQRRDPVAPALTGFGGGHDLDLRQLHADGVTLLGRALGFDGRKIHLSAGLGATLAAGDRAYGAFTDWVEARLYRFDGLYDDPEPRQEFPEPPEPPEEIDLDASGITSIIWATGFRFAFADWLPHSILDDTGFPVHRRGVSDQRGVYFVGLPWQHRRRSPFIRGVEEDARHVAARMAAEPG